jgi:hypothetical protein
MTANQQAVRTRFLIALIAAALAAGCATPASRDEAESRRAAIAKEAATADTLKAFANAAITASSRQTKASAAVEQDYVRWHGGLPSQPALVNYTARVEPSQIISAGNNLRLQSTIEVVSGTTASLRELKEEFVLMSPEGKEIRRGSKIVNENQTGSGIYQNVFTIRPPSNAPQGIYTTKSIVYINGTRVAETNARVELIPERHPDILL